MKCTCGKTFKMRRYGHTQCPGCGFWYEGEEQQKLFIVCRFWLKSKNHPIQEFFAACSTMDIAQRVCDKLTAKFGPTFLIIEAPLDP